MNAAGINLTFDLLSAARQDTRLRRSGAYYQGPCPFCGGRDRFLLKSTSRGWRWFCRKCGEGRYHTAIDYVMRRERLEFGAALARLGGQTVDRLAAPRSRPAVPRIIEVPDQRWQAEALQEMDTASMRLLHGADAAGRQYLSGRGLGRGTWLAWNLGCAPVFDPAVKRERPAILLPWLDADEGGETITAIKYRFIDDDPRGLRYTSRRGSLPALFGLWSLSRDDHTLLLVEGEFNALSIWQCLPAGVSCISFGSDGGARLQLAAAAVRGFRRILVWADDPLRSVGISRALGRRAATLRSPSLEGTKLDANALLQRGLLADFLCGLLGVECLGRASPPPASTVAA